MKNRALFSALGWLGLSIVAFAAIIAGIVFTVSSISKPKGTTTPSESADSAKQTEQLAKMKRMSSLYELPLGNLGLCRVQCTDLQTFTDRLQKYVDGDYAIDSINEQDPAFELAKRLAQHGTGPLSREALAFYIQLQEEPISFKTLSLLSVLNKSNELKIETRNAQVAARQADAIVQRVKWAAASCDTWTAYCGNIEMAVKDLVVKDEH